MEFLRLLEGLRTPAGDAIFSVITLLGEETIFIAAGLFFFWCMNKKHGYFPGDVCSVRTASHLCTVFSFFCRYRSAQPGKRTAKCL